MPKVSLVLFALTAGAYALALPFAVVAVLAFPGLVLLSFAGPVLLNVAIASLFFVAADRRKKRLLLALVPLIWFGGYYGTMAMESFELASMRSANAILVAEPNSGNRPVDVEFIPMNAGSNPVNIAGFAWQYEIRQATLRGPIRNAYRARAVFAMPSESCDRIRFLPSRESGWEISQQGRAGCVVAATDAAGETIPASAKSSAAVVEVFNDGGGQGWSSSRPDRVTVLRADGTSSVGYVGIHVRLNAIPLLLPRGFARQGSERLYPFKASGSTDLAARMLGLPRRGEATWQVTAEPSTVEAIEAIGHAPDTIRH